MLDPDLGSVHTPKVLTMTYANPTWQAYNSDLTRITDEGKAIGPLIAINCGHFIQKDSPKFVSDELTSLLDRVVNRVEQVSERVSGDCESEICACALMTNADTRAAKRDGSSQYGLWVPEATF